MSGAVLRQQRHHVGVVFGRGPHQRRLTELRLADVRVGALGQQRLHDGRVARARRRHQRRLPAAEHRVGLGAGREQHLHHRRDSRRRPPATAAWRRTGSPRWGWRRPSRAPAPSRGRPRAPPSAAASCRPAPRPSRWPASAAACGSPCGCPTGWRSTGCCPTARRSARRPTARRPQGHEACASSTIGP